jgi:hypothetical protein
MSLLENLVCGTPALITDGCNFPEVAQKGAGLCVPCQQGPLEEALKRLLDMPVSTLRAMGQKGRQLVLENYTLDIAARKMITVYNCIIEDKDIPLFPAPFALLPARSESLRQTCYANSISKTIEPMRMSGKSV